MQHKFFTITAATKEYMPRALELKESGLKHGVEVNIIELEDIHRSISPKGLLLSQNTKAHLILEKLRKVEAPVLWLDSDVTIENFPVLLDTILEDCVDLAIYNWLFDPHNAALKKSTYKDFAGRVLPSDRFFEHSHEINLISQNQLICSGAVQLWNISKKSINLLEAWDALVRDNPRCQDDHMLDAVFNYSSDEIILIGLEKSYCRYAFWPHIDPIINHKDFPYGGGDWDDTDRAIGKPRIKRNKCMVRPSNRIAPDGMVWDKLTQTVSPKKIT